jgi:GDPmannose 4,6-dehydratase
MREKTIITGVLGQDGSYLAEYLIESGYEVYGITRRRSSDALSYGFLNHLRDNKNFCLIHGDITDYPFISNLIADIKPSKFFNLAAQSHVGHSFTNPLSTFETDANSVVGILSSIKKDSPATRFYQASTSELFGGISCPETGYDEGSAFHPRSPYGVAKLASFWSTVNFRESFGLFSCNGILFNHGSPRRGLDFFERKLSHNVAKIKLGLSSKIIFGNLDASRDLGDSRDYVKAMNAMLDLDRPEEFVIATGKSYKMMQMVEIMFEIANIGNWKDYIDFDQSLLRPAEVPFLLGNPGKAEKIIGWTPDTRIEKLFEDMYQNDLNILKSK